MHRFYNQDNSRDQIRYNPNMNMRNKTTVKKQLSNCLVKFNEIRDKENQYNQSNLMLNLNKNTVRKSNQYKEDIETQACANHQDRTSEYIVKIDGQILAYCRICATHIASQGFDVHKINLTQTNSNTLIRSSNNFSNKSTGQILMPSITPNRLRQSLPKKEQQIQCEKRSQLFHLTNSLKTLKGEYIQKSQYLTEVSETFSSQKQILTSYYNELISYIQEIRDIHLQAVDESSINTIQVCEIQKGQILETIGQIDQMVYDIDYNMENIIRQVDEQSYGECFDFYKQKQGIFSHRLEELGAEAKAWPCSTGEQIHHKIQNFKAFVNQLHEVGGQSGPQEFQESFIY